MLESSPSGAHLLVGTIRRRSPPESELCELRESLRRLPELVLERFPSLVELLRDSRLDMLLLEVAMLSVLEYFGL